MFIKCERNFNLIKGMVLYMFYYQQKRYGDNSILTLTLKLLSGIINLPFLEVSIIILREIKIKT